ncbi:hypothetical protein ATCC90586_011127 [Pythium insidiosum]|nr:hypothetical protein ATCC90586_011127 [Pythium insidiosum]
MYEARVQPARAMNASRVLPVRGILRGLVLRATGLPHTDQNDLPSAFVRVGFVENTPGDDHSSRQPKSHLMLRCKQALAATRAVTKSSDAVWNQGDLDEDGSERLSGADDGIFQLAVAPPLVGATREPAWVQLRGELLFSVYYGADTTNAAEPAR